MIIGETISLRALNRQDSLKILNWVNDAEVRYYIGTLYPVSDIEHELWFENKLKDKTNKLFGISENKQGNLVGIIGFKNMDFVNRSAELYIYIGEDEERGKGYGSKAVQLLVEFAFKELNLHRMALEVYSYNERALKSYQKVGFKIEGILKESKYKNGKYYDKILMAKLNEADLKDAENE